ncbi:MAG TPA: DUF58 domain-containing protein [Candidatus Hydrogenedentes bacterium]|nr:DUF58 domain-containing protein [Candidatus Hydrogenedentota bacterium]HOL76394.1 DUF58 domain-containing protein [Candidatus Hydrogenedentota bacterium]HPO85432.1 DUF58 domain-containing protein [Candidatus Hydrogenedentota bacterium]
MKSPKAKIKTRPTRHGTVALILTGFVFLIAWNTGLYLYYLALAALGSFLVMSYVMPRRAIRTLEWEVTIPHGVYRRTPFPVTIKIRNMRQWLPLFHVQIGLPDSSTKNLVTIPFLRQRAEVSARFDMNIDRRGVYPVPLVAISSSGPFGFLKTSRNLATPGEIVVYPRVRPLQTSAFNEIQRLGNIPRRTIGDGGDFFSLREYLPGDDLRLVAWRASARTNTLLVRELAAESSRETVIVLDSRRRDLSNFEEELENAIELAASLAQTLINRQFSVGFYAPTAMLPLDHGTAQATKVLDLLARLQPAAPEAPDPFLAATEHEWIPGVRFLFISPDPGAWGKPLFTRFRVLDPREVIYA